MTARAGITALGMLALAAWTALHGPAVLVLVLVLAVLAPAAWWAFYPHHKLPRNRVRHQRLRAHLRLHPGRGMATAGEIWLRWSRTASWRESKRTRPGMTSAWQRWRHPAEHAAYLGRAHFRLRLWLPVQEHLAIVGPPRSFKSALLSRLVMTAPGAALVSSSKPDLLRLSSGVRAQQGPVWLFDPQGVSGLPSNVQWSPIAGCTSAKVAMRRADAFANAVCAGGTEGEAFWQAKTSDVLRSLFTAAAHDSVSLREVAAWAGSDTMTAQAVALLRAAGLDEWAAQLSEMVDSEAEKTAGTIRMFVSRSLSFLRDPELAAAVMPAPGQSFDVDRFLLEGGTLYMISRSDQADSPLAPLFAALAAEIQHRAVSIGAESDGGRLDPPLRMVLDEVTNTCPVPLPYWAADSGGQGVQIVCGFHGLAQLRDRWGEFGAQTVMDTMALAVTPGVKDDELLQQLSRLAGQVSYREHGSDDRLTWHDVLTVAMLRGLPPQFIVIIRGACAPVLAKVAKGWRYRPYRQLARRRAEVATFQPAAALAPPIGRGPGLPVTTIPAPQLAEPEPVAVLNGHANGNGHAGEHGADHWAPWGGDVS